MSCQKVKSLSEFLFKQQTESRRGRNGSSRRAREGRRRRRVSLRHRSGGRGLHPAGGHVRAGAVLAAQRTR